MSVYRIAGRKVGSETEGFETLIAALHGTKDRPLCLCREPGIEVYVAKVNNHYILKRMPNSGATHSPACDSYEPPPELSGLGQVMGSAIEEDVEGGGTLLKLDFSLSKAGYRNAPVPSGKETDSVVGNGNKLTLRGVLHYLWEEAGFNKWSPSMQNKRNWFVIRKYVLLAAVNKTAKGLDLADILFVPESFNPDQKDSITQRRQAHLMRIAAPDKGTRRLMVTVCEVKEIAKSRYGMKMVVKHLPDFQFQLNDDLHMRLIRRFDAELSLWDTHQNSHLMMIATFGINPVGVANLEEIALMVVNENWIPYENAYDHLLIDALTTQRRRFVKGLRYNMPQSRPLAAVVLTDMEPKPCALYITPIGAPEEFIDEQQELIKGSSMPAWVWDATAGGMPAFPQVQGYVSPRRAEADKPVAPECHLDHEQTSPPELSEEPGNWSEIHSDQEHVPPAHANDFGKKPLFED
jgi:hypothetical protein